MHDTQYTHKEYLAGKVGWGHTSFEDAVNAASRAGVKRLLLFHHDPDRSDEELERLERRIRAQVAERGSQLQVFVAREGMEVEV